MASISSDGNGTTEPSSLAQRLEDIINAYYRGNRPPYSRIAEEIRQSTGRTFSATYLWELATGRKRNVTRDQLRVLAEHFGVTPDYFTDEEVSERVRRQMEFAAALGNSKVRTLAFRADSLSEAGLDALLTLVNAMSDQSGSQRRHRPAGRKG
ncbi:helix-turn-helix domain-containing protein [Streptomyces thermospinosisporus]|uniref:Helix-turn-helix domain-containing protein n=1 Tax=Streptomyces thermospinosisporus TaxID=161482 RepID=A0ABP4JFK5_9ACTN